MTLTEFYWEIPLSILGMLITCPILCVTEMALDLQTQMTSDSTTDLTSQIERLREERSDLMKSAKTNEGLKRVKIKLDDAETEMVSHHFYVNIYNQNNHDKFPVSSQLFYRVSRGNINFFWIFGFCTITDSNSAPYYCMTKNL